MRKRTALYEKDIQSARRNLSCFSFFLKKQPTWGSARFHINIAEKITKLPSKSYNLVKELPRASDSLHIPGEALAPSRPPLCEIDRASPTQDVFSNFDIVNKSVPSLCLLSQLVSVLVLLAWAVCCHMNRGKFFSDASRVIDRWCSKGWTRFSITRRNATCSCGQFSSWLFGVPLNKIDW